MTTEMDTGTEKMLAHVADGVGWMTYNNPARHNALSYDMHRAVPRIVRAFAADPEVRVVVVRGAGDQAFASGADISEFGDRRTSVDARADYDAALDAASRSWKELEVPVIAMIRGYCMGAGLVAAMQADIRIASDDAQLSIPAARLGLGYAYAYIEELTALVGPAFAAEILFSARRFSAPEALNMGLVNQVVPGADLERQVQGLAATIADNAPMTVRAAKAALRDVGRSPAERDVPAVQALIEACFRSDDYREGQAAFAEKRPPRFEGK